MYADHRERATCMGGTRVNVVRQLQHTVNM